MAIRATFCHFCSCVLNNLCSEKLEIKNIVLARAASTTSEAGSEGDLVVHGGQAKAGIVSRVRSVCHTPRRVAQVVVSGGAGAAAKV